MAIRRRRAGPQIVRRQPVMATQAPGTRPGFDAAQFAEWTEDVKDGMAHAVEMWRLTARVNTYRTLNGPSGLVTPGSFTGSLFKEHLMNQLLARQVPFDVATAFAEGLESCWRSWFGGYSTVLLYPLFAAYPGPQAPPIPNVPMPLATGSSACASSMTAPHIVESLSSRLAPKMPASAAGWQSSVQGLATNIATSFLIWTMQQRITMVLGKGPVPTFAPPYVPVGPVVAGDLMSTGGVLLGPPMEIA